MKAHWAQALVQELRQVDREEAPHGLYGLRKSRQADARLPNLAHIFVAPPIGLLKRLGAGLQGGQRGNGVSMDGFRFCMEGPRCVSIGIETYADTKVREFGDSFRLDKRSLPADRPPPDLRKLLPALVKRLSPESMRWASERRASSFGLLFIGHFAKQKDLLALIQPVTVPEYLSKHALLYRGDIWQDGYGRDFWSTLQLWYVEQPQKA
jgi:hypothetical protein